MIKRGKKFWVGFDLGGTKMMATVYDAAFKAKASAKAKTPVNEGPKAVQARIRETIAEALKEAEGVLRFRGTIETIPSVHDKWIEYADKARAAIAQAEGRE